MTRGAALVLFGLAICFVSSVEGRGAAAPVPKHLMKEPANESEQLQGRWELVSARLVDDGDLAREMKMVAEFRGNDFTATVDRAGIRVVTAGAVKLAPGGAKAFVHTAPRITDSATPGAVRIEGDQMYAYAFDGEKLVLACSGSAKTAPNPLRPNKGDLVAEFVRARPNP